MDTSIALSLFSMLLSVLFAGFAFYFSNKTDKTLTSIQEKINVQHDNFMRLIEQADANHHDYVVAVTKMLATKRGWLSEETDDLEEELKEAIKVLRLPSPNPTSILSKQSKLGK